MEHFKQRAARTKWLLDTNEYCDDINHFYFLPAGTLVDVLTKSDGTIVVRPSSLTWTCRGKEYGWPWIGGIEVEGDGLEYETC